MRVIPTNWMQRLLARMGSELALAELKEEHPRKFARLGRIIESGYKPENDRETILCSAYLDLYSPRDNGHRYGYKNLCKYDRQTER